jgi:Tfp pilus assembly protein PilE
VTNRLARPDRFRETQANITAQLKHYSYYKGQALLVFPALAASVKKFTLIQAQVDLACVACALERFRLAHGQYPKTLDELVPQFISQLPHDIINGQPLHYRREANNKFVLYSVGWNGTDDGGVTVLRKGGSVDSEKGDWVWKD